jgi:hypothetical protein
MLAARRSRLGKQKMLDFLSELKGAGGKGVALYLPPGVAPDEVNKALGRMLDSQDTPPELSELAAASEQGAIIFWGSSRKCLILPPFPVEEKRFYQNYDIEGLRSILTHDFKVALILIRLGAYAIGVYQGQKLIGSKVGTGLVHARHKQGGSSQARFARHREKQIESFVTRVCRHARDQIEPHLQTLDYVTYGGARTTILLLRKQCHFLGQFDGRTLPPLLDIPEPREAVLETAIHRVWTSGLMEWHDNEIST